MRERERERERESHEEVGVRERVSRGGWCERGSHEEAG